MKLVNFQCEVIGCDWVKSRRHFYVSYWPMWMCVLSIAAKHQSGGKQVNKSHIKIVLYFQNEKFPITMCWCNFCYNYYEKKIFHFKFHDNSFIFEKILIHYETEPIFTCTVSIWAKIVDENSHTCAIYVWIEATRCVDALRWICESWMIRMNWRQPLFKMVYMARIYHSKSTLRGRRLDSVRVQLLPRNRSQTLSHRQTLHG